MTEVTTDTTDRNDRPAAAVGGMMVSVITLSVVLILVNNNVRKFIFTE